MEYSISQLHNVLYEDYEENTPRHVQNGNMPLGVRSILYQLNIS